MFESFDSMHVTFGNITLTPPCNEVQIPVFAKELGAQRINFRRQSVALARILCTAKFNTDFDHLLEGCKKRSVPIRGLTYDLVEPFLQVMLTY